MENLSNRRVLSFKYAFAGIITALKEEPNFKFHILIGFIVILSSLFFKISKEDFIVVLILIGFVTSLELTNTAIEAVVDSFTEQNHPGAKLAKDVSAGAVLVAATTSLAVGILIFSPYILTFLNL